MSGQAGPRELSEPTSGAAEARVVWGRQGLTVLAAALLAVSLGYLAVASPDFLQMDLSLSSRDLLILVAALPISALIFLRPGFGLILLVGFVYLNLSQVLVRFHGLPSLLQLLVLPLLLAALVNGNAVRLRNLPDQMLTVPLLIYSLVILFSTTLARDRSLADERLVENLKATVIYLLVVALARSPAVLRRALWTLLGAGAFLGGIGVAQVASGSFRDDYGGLARIKNAHIYGEVFEPRIAGPLGDPNFFAQILVILVPLGLSLASDGKRLGPKAFASSSVFLISAGAVLTYSRGGAVALGCVLILWLLSKRLYLAQVGAALGLVAILILLLPRDFTRRLATLSQVLPGEEEILHPDSSIEKRKLLTTVAWRMFLDHPLFGVGAGNYASYFEEYAGEVGSVSREYEDPEERHYPHNLYLEIGAETGLLGLVAFAMVLIGSFATLRQAGAAFEDLGDNSLSNLAKGFRIALIGYLVSSLFLHGHFQRYLWLLFALSAALGNLTPRETVRGASDAERR